MRKKYWTFEKCKEEALKYEYRTKFYEKSKTAYQSARKNNWLNEICSHMKQKIKPKGYWTKEKCQAEALKYNLKKDFQKSNNGAYQSARKNNWLNEICSHMLEIKKPKGYWTKEKCQEEALKYTTKNDFRNGSISAYNSSVINDWKDEICSHMIIKEKHPNNYWTFEKCQEEALKYSNRKEFKKHSYKAYVASIDHKWLDDLDIAGPIHHPKNYWTYEICQREAQKYINRSDFEKHSNGAYQKASRSGWKDEICSHMKVKGNRYNRCIYVVEFDDKSVYVGLTYNYEKRIKEHMIDTKKSQVFKYSNKTGLKPIFIKKTEYLDVDIASKKEGEILNEYKLNMWRILNVAKTGGVGGTLNIKWTKEKCQEEASKYKTKSDFKTKSPIAYKSSCEHFWIDELFKIKL